MRTHELGNATSIFTSSGKWAREYRYRVEPSMLGVNIGVAAPMAFFPFGGAKGSLLRRPQGPRPGRDRFLHRQEGGDHALVLIGARIAGPDGRIVPGSSSATGGPRPTKNWSSSRP